MKSLSWKTMTMLVTLTAVVCSASLQAGEKGKAKGKTKTLRGEFLYAHPPAPVLPPDPDNWPPEVSVCYVPEIEGLAFCFPVPGVFSGQSTHIGVFGGEGSGESRVYFNPVIVGDDIIIADFSGEFTWSKPSGSLSGTITGYNYPIPGQSPDIPVFGIVLELTIEEGTGRFTGATGKLLADGIDDPYGYLGINGVLCDFEGTLKLAK